MRSIAAALLVLTLSSCEVIEQPSGLIPRWTAAYRQVISENDRVRLRDWRKSFEDALAEVTKAGHGAEIAREGVLLDPDAAQAGATLPNGMYNCRVIKLGAKDPGNLEFVSMPASDCRIHAERQLQRLGKLGGAQRYVGLIFSGDEIRNVFLGTLALGDERRALQYGQDEKRDVAGYLERIGPNRWRLLMPQPHFDSKFDVMELTPRGATH